MTKIKEASNEKIQTIITRIDKRVGSVDKMLDGIDKRIETMSKRFDGIDERIENLARMTADGFEETATKAEMNQRFEQADIRFDRIENILLRDHNNRIERLEDKLLQVEVLLGSRLK